MKANGPYVWGLQINLNCTGIGFIGKDDNYPQGDHGTRRKRRYGSWLPNTRALRAVGNKRYYSLCPLGRRDPREGFPAPREGITDYVISGGRKEERSVFEL